jgi:predicted transcriptional regulator
MAVFIEKQKTGSTPYILVDGEKGYIKFEGESFHENVIAFFKDVTEWLDAYLESGFTTLTFDCNLHYFNSSTAKLLLNMLMAMDEHAIGGRKVVVNWITVEGNDIITECGEDFREEMSNLEFNLIIKTD